MVWDSTNIAKSANRQGFFRNKDGLADKPNHTHSTPQQPSTSTPSGSGHQGPQTYVGAPAGTGLIPQAQRSTLNPQLQQSPSSARNYEHSHMSGRPPQGVSGYVNNNYHHTQQQQYYSPGSDLAPSPTVATTPSQANNVRPLQPQRSVGAKSASDVTDKITGPRLWSKDNANHSFPQDDTNSPQRRNRSNSLPSPLDQQTPPQQALQQRQPDPLPVGYNPRASLSNSLIGSASKQLAPHAPPTHLPPLGQYQSGKLMGGDLNSSMNNLAPHSAYATEPIANGGYTSPPTAGVYHDILPQISPVPSSDLVQLVMRNYEEAQRSYLSVR